MPVIVSHLDDGDLVALSRDGSREAFEEIIRRHGPRLHGLAMGMMRNQAEAQDAVQDALLNAWRRLDGFRGDAAIGSWLYRVTANACLMRLRRKRRRPEVSLDSGPDDQPIRQLEDPSARIDELYLQRELASVIRDGMDALPDAYRAVFVLADLEHRSMKEIGDILDLTIPNVKTRLHRARLRLRAHLTHYLAGLPARDGETP